MEKNKMNVEEITHTVIAEQSRENTLKIIEQRMKGEEERLPKQAERLNPVMQEGDALTKALKGSKVYLHEQKYSQQSKKNVTMEEKRLCELYEVYKEFYGKEPDFKKENKQNITIEMQAMAFLLSQYGIAFYDYQFASNEYKDLKMPMSMKLQDIIVGKLLGRENEELKSEMHMSEQLRNTIN